MNSNVQTVNMRNLKYTDLPNGLHGWHDPTNYYPKEFDLVEIQTEEKTITGWWTGNYWMGLRLCKNDKVKSWKKARELDYI